MFLQSDEDKIRDLVAGAVQAANDRHPGRVSRILSEDFVGASEALVEAGLKRFGKIDAATMFSGRVVTGRFLDSSSDDLKEVVYTMRFDEASALYGEFGRFVTALVAEPSVVMRRIGLA